MYSEFCWEGRYKSFLVGSTGEQVLLLTAQSQLLTLLQRQSHSTVPGLLGGLWYRDRRRGDVGTSWDSGSLGWCDIVLVNEETWFSMDRRILEEIKYFGLTVRLRELGLFSLGPADEEKLLFCNSMRGLENKSYEEPTTTHNHISLLHTVSG